MAKKQPVDEIEPPAMGSDPLADDEILASTFYQTEERPSRPAAAPVERKKKATPRRPARRRKKAAPTHYKIVSISLYNEDIERIDQIVQDLKDSGHPKANRSALIRYAIDTVDVSKMPKSY